MRMPRFNPWQTLGTTDRLDAIERAVRIVRKHGTVEEKRAGLALIRELVAGIERHLNNFTPDGMPKAPPMPGGIVMLRPDEKPEPPPGHVEREGWPF